jgi:hypothetical protein
MGINAQTSVPKFTAGDTLTAANTNLLSNGIPVFGGTALRDAAFGGSGEKVLAEGQYAYLEDTNTTQFYDGAAWQPVGVAPGLVLITAQTIGSAVGSVAVTNAFSSTYDHYKITINGGVGSNSNFHEMILTGSTANYNNKLIYGTYANNTVTGIGVSAQAKWSYTGSISTASQNMNLDIYNPFAAVATTFSCSYTDQTADPTSAYGSNAGIHNVATSYTGFTISPNTGTITGGTICVYGYAKS